MGRLISDYYREGEVLASKARELEKNGNKCNCSSSNRPKDQVLGEQELDSYLRSMYGSAERDRRNGLEYFESLMGGSGSEPSTEVDESEGESESESDSEAERYIEVEQELFSIPPSTPASTRPSTPPNLRPPFLFRYPEVDISQTPHTPTPRRDVLSETVGRARGRRMPAYHATSRPRNNNLLNDLTNDFTLTPPSPSPRGRALGFNGNLSNITENDSEDRFSINHGSTLPTRGNVDYMRRVFDELRELEPGSPGWNALTQRTLRRLAPGGFSR